MEPTNIQAPLPQGNPFAVVYSLQLHYLYLDVNGHISDIFWDTANWHYQDWNALRPEAPLAQGDPFAVVYGNEEHNIYLDVNQQISDIFWDGSNWHYRNLNALRTDAPLSQGDPFAIVYNNELHYIYLDINGQISDIFWDGSKWNYRNLNTLRTDAPLSQGDPFVIVYSLQLHYLYLDVNGHISDIFWDTANWHYQDWNALRPEAPLSQGKPFSVIYGIEEHNIYLDVNQQISDIWWDGTSNWHYRNLNTLLSDAPLAQGDPFAVVYSAQLHHLYLDVNGHISDIWWDGSKWCYQDWNKLRPEAPLGMGNPFAVVYGNEEHNLYLDVNGQISDIYWDGSNWHYRNVNNIFPYVTQMLMLSGGSLSAPTIENYQDLQNELTLTMMVQPQRPGTIISTHGFKLRIDSRGCIVLSLRKNTGMPLDKWFYYTSDPTSIIKSGQCHIVACSHQNAGETNIYLDGQSLGVVKSDGSWADPSPDNKIVLGNSMSGDDQYMGGMMNVGIWNRILNQRESTLSGYGQIGEPGAGPVAYWYLDGSLLDDSVYSNNLQPGAAIFTYMPCPNYMLLYGPNSYSFCQIEGTVQQGPVTNLSYTQTVRVGSDAVAILATVIDNSGYARFPEGVFVTVTDPNGKIYNQDASPTDGSVFVQTIPVSGYSTNSLFALLVNNPKQGIWTINIIAPSNVYFVFQIQAYPSSDIISSHYEAFRGMGMGGGDRTAVAQDFNWGKILAGTALMIAGAVIAVASGGTGTPAAIGLLTMGTGLFVANDGVADAALPIHQIPVTIKPKIDIDLYTTIVASLNTERPNLKGKVWDVCKGTLSTNNWLLQSGTVDEETNLKTTFSSFVNSATKTIDVLIFGGLSGDFLTDLKTFINGTQETLTIRIFTGIAFEKSACKIDTSSKAFISIGLSSDNYVDEACKLFSGLLNNIGAIPDNISLYVAAGAVPESVLSNFTFPVGWGHHKVLIVDGTQTITGGMNYWNDSLKAPSEDAVNDLAALIKGGTVGSIQNFVNNFWSDLAAPTLTENFDFPVYKEHSNISGAYYYPESLAKGIHCFALLGSKPFDDVQTLVQSLNSVFTVNTNPTDGNCNVITVGRRNGYYFDDREPSDIAIISMIKSAKSSLYLSQQALCYPTQDTTFVWPELFTQIGLALNRGVSVNIIVSRNPNQEGRDFTGGYSSDFAINVRTAIMKYVADKKNAPLKVYNYPTRNHAKVVIVDSEAFYLGSQNVYPSKFPLMDLRTAGNTLAALGIYANPIASISALTAIQCLAAILPESYNKLAYEVGLGEYGILVCDNGKTQEFINAYWNEKWAAATKGTK